ncbi:MAG: hypothetical protein EOO11_11655 [Chitinophagaceae bacterium]|nr:MAG: hypothetical protein EOO11_11655 [Chitinophagaceae bacterium]
MRSLLLAVTLLLVLAADGQKRFDSAAYVRFYEGRFENGDALNAHRQAPERPLSAEERILGLSRCWSEARYNFANFDLVPGLSWDSLYTAFLPRVAAAAGNHDYYRLLQAFYSHLRDGHTGISLPPSMTRALNGVLPVEIRLIEGHAIVVANTSERKEDARIRPGAEVLAVNDTALNEYVRTRISPYLSFSTPQDSIERIYRTQLLLGRAGSTVRLTFRDGAGAEWTQPLAYKLQERYWERFPLLTFRVLPGNVGYLQLNSFGDERIVRLFASIFPQVQATSALLIDLRNNGGGNGSNGFAIIGRLSASGFAEGGAFVRQYRPVGRSWGGIEQGHIETDLRQPHPNRVYDRPVAVLTGAATYSAAEDFVSAFRMLRRGTVIGEPTGGSSGQPLFFTLPGGGLGRVCAKRDFLADGTEFIGIGIRPDLLLRPTVKGVLAGRDEVLERALELLAKGQAN